MHRWIVAIFLSLFWVLPVSSQQPGSFKGQLLIATPQNLDPRFAKTVLFMVDHDAKGALGIIINKPFGKGPLANMMKGLGLDPKGATGDTTLHFGGPVAYNQIFILHSSEYRHDRTRDVDGTVSFSESADILRDVVAGKGPKKILVAAGYAGWSAGQLEGEIDRGFWRLTDASSDHVFGKARETLWDRLFEGAALPL